MNKLKETVSLVLSALILLSMVPFSAFAEDKASQSPEAYTVAQKQVIYAVAQSTSPEIEKLFCNDDNLAYRRSVNQIKDNPILSFYFGWSSGMLDVNLDETGYGKILSALMALQTYKLAGGISQQKEFDDLKTELDYYKDAISIGASFASMYLESIPESKLPKDDIQRKLSSAIGKLMASSGALGDIKNGLAYFTMACKDYSESAQFLNAVSQYSNNTQMRAAAKNLIGVNEELFLERINKLAQLTTYYGLKFGVKEYLENFSGKLLYNCGSYGDDDFVRFSVDASVAVTDTLLSATGGSVWFESGILVGDILFGTSDTFTRYQEMVAVSDVASAMMKANNKVDFPEGSIDDRDFISTSFDSIQEKLLYYQYMLVAHARGEYLVYSLLSEDAHVLSNVSEIVDDFKEPSETNRNWYERQTDVIERYYNLISDFNFEGNSAKEALADEGVDTLPFIAEELTWAVEPTYSFTEVAPVYARDFSDVGIKFGNKNVSNATHNLFDDMFAGAEMNFPEYSCLSAYYSVTENGQIKLFHMPTMTDSGKFSLPTYTRWSVDDTMGIEYFNFSADAYSPSYEELEALKQPWNVIHECARGGGSCVVGWDVATKQAYLYGDGEGAWTITPVAKADLHKPYAAKQYDFSCAGANPQGEVDGFWDETIDFTAHTDNVDKYALVSATGALLTDFIYEDMASCSEGITAACLNGKWGYLDETGKPITEFEFDAPWSYRIHEEYSPDKIEPERIPLYCAFPCTSDTIVVQKDGKYGLLYRDGTLLIDYGQFGYYAPAYDNKLWTFDDSTGKWGLIDLAPVKKAYNQSMGRQEDATPTPTPTPAPTPTTTPTPAPTARKGSQVAGGDCGVGGNNITWTLDANGLLKIEGSGAMQDYDYLNMIAPPEAITSFVAPYLDQIKAVEISPGVTSIGVCAFICCDRMVSVSIPDTVSVIGYNAFSGCSSLTEFKFPSGIMEIGLNEFSGCTNLKSITIPTTVTKLFLTDEYSGLDSLTDIYYQGSEADWNNMKITGSMDDMPGVKVHYNSK